MLIPLFLVGCGAVVCFFYLLGFRFTVNFISHYEDKAYGPFLEPHSVEAGLAIYEVGSGKPILLFPYPHGHTRVPMAQGELAQLLIKQKRQVLTFDVPGAYQSTREPTGEMAEMIASADEALDRSGISTPIDVMGHSMGGFCALAYAVERPERVNRLIIVGGVSGFPAAARCGLPRSAFSIWDLNFWRVVFGGLCVSSGRANLAMHKRLHNLMSCASYYDKTLFVPLKIDADDHKRGVPIRMIWSRNMFRQLTYADRLDEIRAPTLILVGRHDPQASIKCAEELHTGITNSEFKIFEKSGHYPFVEEPKEFVDQVMPFLNGHQNILSPYI